MIIKVWFSEAGAAKTGLSPTIDITDVSDGSLDINDAAMTELANGWYKYDFSAIDTSKEYVYLVDGGATLSDPERYISGKLELNDLTIAGIIAGVSDGSYDLQEMTRIIFSAVALLTSGGGTSTLKSRDSADIKDRITLTVDSNGNRTNVVLDGS